MFLIQKLAEEKIAAAIERGELDNLPGQGQPLELDDNHGVPEELRAAFRLLKNAGYLPPEMALRKEICEIEQLLHHVDTADGEKSLMKRLSLLRCRLARDGGGKDLLLEEARYREKLLNRLSADRDG